LVYETRPSNCSCSMIALSVSSTFVPLRSMQHGYCLSQGRAANGSVVTL
jgi:hypothetical protein